MRKKIGIIFLFGVLTFNLYKTFEFLWPEISVMKNFPRRSYDEKMREKYGSYYDFMLFVKENTPSDAVILVPPMRPPWAGSGNYIFSNYFLYPRKLIGSEIDKPPQDFKKFTHVLVVWKDFEAKGLDDLYGWPKFAVSAQEILYMPANSAEKIQVKKGNYSPKDEVNIGRYGLIKL